AKPISKGSSVGVHIVQEGDNMLLLEDGPEDELLLVEEFIPGRELSVAVLDDEALGVIEIRPKAGFYDYTNKYTSGKTEYLIPAPVSEVISGRAASMAVQAHHMLGCRGVSRADIRFDEATDRLVMLEVNTHPGMTPTSLVPKIAAHAGISFPELIERLLKTARCDSVPVEEK
ncbi:MAG: D-alanine--D-alanine ligase, partial [Rickettsiales bacterium]|nr:D-alanine--D-alanine ligase [Rickettsiales bacterium]